MQTLGSRSLVVEVVEHSLGFQSLVAECNLAQVDFHKLVEVVNHKLVQKRVGRIQSQVHQRPSEQIMIPILIAFFLFASHFSDLPIIAQLR